MLQSARNSIRTAAAERLIADSLFVMCGIVVLGGPTYDTRIRAASALLFCYMGINLGNRLFILSLKESQRWGAIHYPYVALGRGFGGRRLTRTLFCFGPGSAAMLRCQAQNR